MYLGRTYGKSVTRALFVGGRTIEDKWSVCCCVLVDVYQDKVPKNPSASP